MDLTLWARGDVNHLTFGCLSTPVTVQSLLERRAAGQVRTEQVAPVSTRNSVLLPATSRLTRGSAGVVRMDRVGSGAGKALRPHQLVCRNLSLERIVRTWGQSSLPLGCLTGKRSGHSPFQCPAFQQKAYLFEPRQLLGSLSRLLGPPASLRDGGWIRAAKSCVFCFNLLSLLDSSIKSRLL